MDDGDSSYEEDFSEVTQMFSTDVELPKEETKKEESPFEIVSMENIVQEVFDIVMRVQSFINVRTFFLFFVVVVDNLPLRRILKLSM